MTMDEAGQALRPAEAALIENAVYELVTNGVSTTVNASQLAVEYTTGDVLAEAMALARTGDLESLELELEDIRINGRRFNIDYTITDESIRSYIAGYAQNIDTAPTPATFTVKQLEINPDTNANRAQDIGLPTLPEGMTEEQAIAQGMNRDLRDLRFDFVEAIDGYGVDQEELFKLMNERMRTREYGKIDVPLAPIESDVTVATIKDSLVLRSSAYTSYAKGHYGRATRVHNMTKACGLMYATVLQPGDQFSCNTILGDRTEKLGWQMAPAVIEGGAATEDQAGGGVCQVSTTLYNAVLKSNLEITYRRAHSQKLSYVAGGLDATINTGTIDFTWKNNLTSPIYVFTWIDTENKRINAEIYGEPFPDDYDEIKLESEELDPILPTDPTYDVDVTLAAPYWRLKNDAQKGYVFETYQLFIKDGKTIDKRLIAKTTYNMHPARYLVWMGWAGEALTPEYKLEYIRE